MKISKIAILVLSLLLPLSIQAQKKKKVVKKQPAVVVIEVPQEDPRITEMREVTQQIIFIDSMVVDKAQFLSAIRLNQESGSLTTYDQFFHSEDHADRYVYLNEMGNKCYFSDEDAQGQMQLFTSDLLGGEWSSQQPLRGISDGIVEANYPFMMADGTTFYFAAKGTESIGGYDIFVTRYDSYNGQFLKPENIGMPFNSEANDYMYVIDEMSQIGYFVTDRRQPQGKVCVYIFIPPSSRRTYPLDRYSDDQLRRLAAITRISDTWGKGKEQQQALERWQAIQTKQVEVAQSSSPAISFVINDQLTYTSVNQFRSPEGATLYQEWAQTRQRLANLKAKLDKSRTFYTKAKADDKEVLRTEILDDERLEEMLTTEMRQLEKIIRNTENQFINLK